MFLFHWRNTPRNFALVLASLALLMCMIVVYIRRHHVQVARTHHDNVQVARTHHDAEPSLIKSYEHKIMINNMILARTYKAKVGTTDREELKRLDRTMKSVEEESKWLRQQLPAGPR
jgi:hypothetical protein